VLREIEEITGRPVNTSFGPWRAGDQAYFVADTRKLERETGWAARVGWRNGLRHLAEWLIANRFGGQQIRREKRKVMA